MSDGMLLDEFGWTGLDGGGGSENCFGIENELFRGGEEIKGFEFPGLEIGKQSSGYLNEPAGGIMDLNRCQVEEERVLSQTGHNPTLTEYKISRSESNSYPNLLQSSKIEELERKLNLMMAKLQIYEDDHQNFSTQPLNPPKNPTLTTKNPSCLKSPEVQDPTPGPSNIPIKSEPTPIKKPQKNTPPPEPNPTNIIREIRDDISQLKQSFNSIIQDQANFSTTQDFDPQKTTNIGNQLWIVRFFGNNFLQIF